MALVEMDINLFIELSHNKKNDFSEISKRWVNVVP
jgi:hypothetical protein